MLNIIVFQFRVVDYITFVNVLDMTDINEIMDNIPYLDRNSWEQTRFDTFIMAKANFKGIKKTQDLLKFPWEENPTNDEMKKTSSKAKPTTKQDVENMKKLAERWAKNK